MAQGKWLLRVASAPSGLAARRCFLTLFGAPAPARCLCAAGRGLLGELPARSPSGPFLDSNFLWSSYQISVGDLGLHLLRFHFENTRTIGDGSPDAMRRG